MWVSSSPLVPRFEEMSGIHAKLVESWLILQVLSEIVQQQKLEEDRVAVYR
jgi:hypothetical protein